MLSVFRCFVRSLIWASGLLLFADAALADSPQLKAAWQQVLERRQFHFPKEDADVLGSLSRFSSDSKVHLLYDSKHRASLEFKFVHDGKEVLSLRGHILSAFATADEHLYFAEFSPYQTGCEVSAYDLTSGKRLWQTNLAHKQPFGHSAYANRVTLRMSNVNEIENGVADAAVIVTGSESYCDYVEVLDSKTGEMLALKNYRTGFDYREFPGSKGIRAGGGGFGGEVQRSQ